MFLKKKIQEPLKIILRNPGINVNELLKQSTAVRNAKQVLDEFQKQKIIISVKKANQRQLFANMEKDNFPLFECVEMEELNKAKKKYHFLGPILKRTDAIKRLLGQNLRSIILFGSLARFESSGQSDIDLLILVEDTEKIPELKINKIIQNMELEAKKEISQIWLERKEYRAQLPDPGSLASQIQKNHIILHGTKEFLV